MNLSVFCLCAQWCDTCGEFQALFEQAANQHPQDRFLWVDIETHAQLLGDLDIENFPTIAITRNAQLCFFGPILPHLETLQRLCLAAQAGDLAPITDSALTDVVQKLNKLL